MKTLIVLAGVLFFWVSTVEAQVIVDTKTTTTAKSSTTTKSATGKSTVTKTTTKKTTSKKSKFDADKSIGKANDAVNKTSQTANNATDIVSSTANKAKDFVHKIIPPKKQTTGVVSNTTDITIKGLTFAALSKLNDNVQACPGVQTSTMKFSGSKSTITVAHSGTTADLLKQIEMRSKDVFTDENVSDFKEGKIYIKLKSN
jgi:hypothetical protein